ncbi:hypothetical protein C2S51_015153 [Perilla frutescens var. frutescens]|nr:hypothetical protein C2S51_015153 [Perilla frutescens var. frutescens]
MLETLTLRHDFNLLFVSEALNSLQACFQGFEFFARLLSRLRVTYVSALKALNSLQACSQGFELPWTRLRVWSSPRLALKASSSHRPAFRSGAPRGLLSRLRAPQDLPSGLELREVCSHDLRSSLRTCLQVWSSARPALAAFIRGLLSERRAPPDLPSAIPKTTSTNLATDESALLDFKAHIITSNPYHNILTTNWSNSSSVCSWFGVTCGVHHRRVISLIIPDMGLSGTISPQVGNLSFLAALDLGFNNLSGTLPLELALLHRLKFISIKFNNLVGEIPSWLGFLPRLEYLNLRNNSFTGCVPMQLSNLSNLQFLELSYNPLDEYGIIPEDLGRLHNLQVLSMQGNRLSGVIPSSIFNMSSLKIIAFRVNELRGSLPNELCKNLPFLEELYLGDNKLSGQIPSNLSQCGTHLRILGLSYNMFSGGIPPTIEELTTLQILELGGVVPQEIGNLQIMIALGVERNEFSGGVPTNIFNISSMQTLFLFDNKLVGDIPRDMNNLTSLRTVDISDNYLTGVLPREFGQLEHLRLDFNSVRGIIPPEFFNISTRLRSLSLVGNSLSGALPTNMCNGGSPVLEELFLGQNNINGVIPDSLSNCSHLNILALSDNKFTGFRPHIFGNLPFLQALQLFHNDIRTESSSFITSLTNCRSLTHLAFGDNPLYGIIPASVGNLSSSLQTLMASNCKLEGNIPPHIGNLSNLSVLTLAGNDLSGNIPSTIKHLNELQGVDLHTNNIRGPIPEGMCGLNSLNFLFLGQNKLSGPIPECLGNVTALRGIDLSWNKLSSNIPTTLWGLKDLLQLDLSKNYLTGPLPVQIQNLRAAIYINLSMNQLSESIPSTIGNLQNLVNLSLARNRLQGSIPESMGSMLSLVSLDFSNNKLSGFIPKSLEALGYLKYLNLSFNDLSGEIPTGGPFKNLTIECFQFNEALCGAPRFNVPPCSAVSHHTSKRKKVEYALFIVPGVVLLIVIVPLAIIFTRCRRKENRAGGVDELPSILQERISYYQILQATQRFDESNLLGLGSFGSVYRGILKDGETIAVKVFNLQSEAVSRSFDVECEVLRNTRHRNLIKVIGSCSNLDFKALVLEYMPNGNLDQWLYSHNYCLDVLQRLNIMIDVASALEYLHHGCSMPIVHCDLKPSNVLLDDEMVSHVSDFGIAKLFTNEESNIITNTLATLGYIAPEYGLQGVVSTKCDVYSYGIMLMETFTRKRPSDDMFAGDLSLRSWVENSFPESSDQVIDVNLLNPEERNLEKKVECVSSVLKLGLKCTSEFSGERINMKEALAELHKIKHQFSH